jgi:hypothetical protein
MTTTTTQWDDFEEPEGGCSCHISPPCSWCIDLSTALEKVGLDIDDWLEREREKEVERG